jgi:hypothetical protein
MDDLPAGEYAVQAFFNVYETAYRSDGSVVSMHFPCGDGGNIWASPGNFTSEPLVVTIDPATSAPIDLELTNTLEPAQVVPEGGTCQQGNPAESALVKQVKIKSEALSEFWGRDIYVAATVLLPVGYFDPANAEKKYPLEIVEGHYSTRAPHGYSDTSTSGFSAFWRSASAPEVISMTIRTENPFYDDSYNVNSVNLGPYGDALNKELLPTIDSRFRTIGEGWSRFLTGGSTGGWISMATQVFYPDTFGGTWSGYPDSLDFNAHQKVDLYNDDNAYIEADGSPTPSSHSFNAETGVDTINFTMVAENHFELAVGSKSRSMGQWDIWNAVYGVQGPNCYPLEPWNKATGVIDRAAVEQWKPMDMSEYVSSNWSKIGPSLAGKLNVYVGTQDTYYLNLGVDLFDKTVQTLSNPAPDAEFIYGQNQPHGYTPYTAQEWITLQVAEINSKRPAEPQPAVTANDGNLWTGGKSGCSPTPVEPTPTTGDPAAAGSSSASAPAERLAATGFEASGGFLFAALAIMIGSMAALTIRRARRREATGRR